jgi:hypothetical protein
MERKDITIWRGGCGAVAILLALVGIAIVTPNMGYFVNDPATRFVRSFRDEVFVYAAPVIPLTCIFVGMFWQRSLVEHIGWALLIILFVGSLRG